VILSCGQYREVMQSAPKRSEGALCAKKGVPLVGRDPKPTPLSKLIERTAATARPADVPPPRLQLESAFQEAGRDHVADALDSLLSRDDGWLRITPQNDGETVYWKWKWTAGKHINHYVMVVYPKSQSGDALLRLALKVHAVDRGEKIPVKDHYFKG
jgi:hypothetical protein